MLLLARLGCWATGNFVSSQGCHHVPCNPTQHDTTRSIPAACVSQAPFLAESWCHRSHLLSLWSRATSTCAFVSCRFTIAIARSSRRVLVAVPPPWWSGSTSSTLRLPISPLAESRYHNSRLTSSPSRRHKTLPAIEGQPPCAATQISLPNPNAQSPSSVGYDGMFG